MAELREGNREALTETDYICKWGDVSRSCMSSTRFHKICFLDPAVSVNVSDICLLRSGDGWDADRDAVDPQFEPSATGGERAREREKVRVERSSLPTGPKRGGCIGISKLQTPLR